MPTKVSANMVDALARASLKELGSWDFGSGTLGSLKKRGWVREVDVRVRGRVYGLTPAGEAALEKLQAGGQP